MASAKPSALVDTRVIYYGDNLEQLRKLPPACVDLICIDPPFNSNRNYEVFWGETKEKRAFEDRHESTRAYIDTMRPRCVELARVLSLRCALIIQFFLLALSPTAFGQSTAQDYLNRGIAKGHKGDESGAITDLDTSIRLDPNNAVAYLSRGCAKRNNRDASGAITDFETAIRLDPNNTNAPRCLADLKISKGDLDGAIATYTEAIANCEKVKSIHTPFFYALRSALKRDKGDLDGALDDSNEGVKRDRENYHAYRSRAEIFYLKHDWRKALSDYRDAIKHAVKGDNQASEEICHIYIWMMRVKLGEKPEADKELADYEENHTQSDYAQHAKKIAGFMLGHVPEKDLFPTPDAFDFHGTQPALRCFAWYFVGMKKLFAGEKDEAKKCFQKSLNERASVYEESHFAASELKALGE